MAEVLIVQEVGTFVGNSTRLRDVLLEIGVDMFTLTLKVYRSPMKEHLGSSLRVRRDGRIWRLRRG